MTPQAVSRPAGGEASARAAQTDSEEEFNQLDMDIQGQSRPFQQRQTQRRRKHVLQMGGGDGTQRILVLKIVSRRWSHLRWDDDRRVLETRHRAGPTEGHTSTHTHTHPSSRCGTCVSRVSRRLVSHRNSQNRKENLIGTRACVCACTCTAEQDCQ